MKINEQNGFTMMEFLVAAIIVALVAGFAAATYEKMVERSNIRKATLNLRAVYAASYAYRATHGAFPTLQCGSYAAGCVDTINTTLGTAIVDPDMIYSYNFKNASYPNTSTFTVEATRITPFYCLQVSESSSDTIWCEGHDWP